MGLARRASAALFRAARATTSHSAPVFPVPGPSRAAPVLATRSFGGAGWGHARWLSSATENEAAKGKEKEAEQKPAQGSEGAEAKKQEGAAGQDASKGPSETEVLQMQLKEKTDLLKKKDDEIRELKNQCESLFFLIFPFSACLGKFAASFCSSDCPQAPHCHVAHARSHTSHNHHAIVRRVQLHLCGWHLQPITASKWAHASWMPLAT